jgi:glucose/arabinose dehydrogenase
MRFNSLQGVMVFGLALASCGTAALPSEDRPASGGMPFRVAPVASFDTPWAMTFLPGGAQALISEKDGRLWVVDTASGAKTAVTGVPKAVVAGQGGLGDVVVGPDNRIYLSYVEGGQGGTSGAVVGYGRLLATSAAAPGSPAGYSLHDFKIVWRQAPKVTGAGHFSHRIAFGPEGAMYVTSGDRQKGSPAQATDGNLGKVLRLTPEGQPFPGNPWAAKGGVEAQLYSTGHRNLLGIAFAPDKRLWEHEMGPQGGDEVNLILPGRNYGWPVVSNGSEYGGGEIPDHPTRPEFEQPKVWWNPSISPAGLIVYTGDLFPTWKGDLLLGALSGESLIRVDVNGDKASKAERWNMGSRIREVEQGPRGEVYLLEDGGRLLRLTPAG